MVAPAPAFFPWKPSGLTGLEILPALPKGQSNSPGAGSLARCEADVVHSRQTMKIGPRDSNIS
jgi:hypothetical protein